MYSAESEKNIIGRLNIISKISYTVQNWFNIEYFIIKYRFSKIDVFQTVRNTVRKYENMFAHAIRNY